MTIKPVLLSPNKENLYQIYFRVIIDRKIKHYSTGKYIKKDHFKDGAVIKHPQARLINTALEIQRSKIMEDYLGKEISGEVDNYSVFELIEKKQKFYSDRDQPGALYKLTSVYEGLKKVWGTDHKKATQQLVNLYVNTRLKSGIAKSTLKKDLANLFRATGDPLFSEAQKSIRADPPDTNRLTLEEIKRLQEVKLSPPDDLVRDMFLFSFYCHGMRAENVITFKKSMIQGNLIKYRMNKGKVIREIHIHGKLEKLIKKYNGHPYLFPLLKTEVKSVWDKKPKVGNSLVSINKRLKSIAEYSKINKRLTFHVARHTFAYLTLERNVSTRIIKDLLGHSSISTTEKYLKRLDEKTLNEAAKGLYD